MMACLPSAPPPDSVPCKEEWAEEIESDGWTKGPSPRGAWPACACVQLHSVVMQRLKVSREAAEESSGQKVMQKAQSTLL